MARPTRKKISFDEQSANKLFQEIYEESFNIKAKIARLFTKWEIKIKETGEVAAIGDQIVKLIAAEAKNQDQKIMLLKFLKEVVFDKGTTANNQNPEEDKNLSSDRKNELLKMVESEIERKEKERNK